MRPPSMPPFEIEEPVGKEDFPVFPREAWWTDFFRDIADRLVELNGLALPVKFSTQRGAGLCRSAFGYRSTVRTNHRYAPLPDGLRAAQRRERVFFWLEKAEVPA